jgi:hypothetical protein
MLTLKEWMELVDYKITEGSDYGWSCYGNNPYCLDSWNGDQDGYSFGIVFDTKTQVVYEVSVCDYQRQRAYRMINPDYQQAHDDESKQRGVELNTAWDEVDYIDLDVDDDFFQKGLAIRADEDYDTRVEMQVDLPDDVILKAAMAAHELDITLNEYIGRALAEFVDEVKQGKFTREDAQEFIQSHEC